MLMSPRASKMPFAARGCVRLRGAGGVGATESGDAEPPATDGGNAETPVPGEAEPPMPEASSPVPEGGGKVLSVDVATHEPPPPMVVSLALARRCNQSLQVLLTRRRAGEWHLHGGKVEPGEAEADAVRRETLEDVDVVVADTDLFLSLIHI